MPITWKTLANNDPTYEEDDFKRSLYQLITEQALYHSDAHQRLACSLVFRHRKEFKEAAALMGVELHFDDQYRYVTAVPKVFRKNLLSTQETLLILVLRKIYHQRNVAGDVDEFGSVKVEIEDLQDIYRDATAKELPGLVTELREQVGQLKRYGIARVVNIKGDLQPFQVEIRPAIAVLVDEALLSTLDVFIAPLEGVEDEESGDDDENA